ncbi:zinc finger protein ZAT9-like [Mangifera indica]|uniref:zinc finger protein ZAT9-like n=1 Tax=Mangifera indica TaxID=29780 RepID=UPI001CF97CC4|nr:zinc finger protein ZAT9-like [Mangifera indica]
MEKHKCKLCLKNFSNGRALGGHMRSHMLNFPIPARQDEEEEEEEEEETNRLRDDTESSSSPASSSPSEEEEEEGELEKGSVILQDRESETESSKNPTRRRSKRTRKLENRYQYHHHQQQQQPEQEMVKKLKFNKLSKTESWAEPEPVSSISDTTTEEDVAFCLMMLSRDKWKRKEQKQQQQRRHEVREEEEENEDAEKSMEETDESEEFKSSKQRSRGGKYKCETCKKVFKSYQALGGHRASHKKIKFYSATQEPESEQENAGTSTSVPIAGKKIHECPVCFRVFSSGQALGGHKRTHVTGLVTATMPPSTSTPGRSRSKLGENLIDLNLPAPIDDDDISQIELSAVSDAEYVNHIKR